MVSGHAVAGADEVATVSHTSHDLATGNDLAQ